MRTTCEPIPPAPFRPGPVKFVEPRGPVDDHRTSNRGAPIAPGDLVMLLFKTEHGHPSGLFPVERVQVRVVSVEGKRFRGVVASRVMEVFIHPDKLSEGKAVTFERRHVEQIGEPPEPPEPPV